MPLHSHCQQPGSFKSGALTCRQAAIAKRPCLISISCHLTKHSSGSTCSCSCSSSVVQASVHATLTLHGDTQIAHRRYLSGILVISPSGSYTPSGFVVPMSPGVIADMTTDGATRLADRTGALNAEGAIATIEVAMLTADGNSNGNGSDREKQANTNLQPNAQARAEDERGSSRPRANQQHCCYTIGCGRSYPILELVLNLLTQRPKASHHMPFLTMATVNERRTGRLDAIKSCSWCSWSNSPSEELYSCRRGSFFCCCGYGWRCGTHCCWR